MAHCTKLKKISWHIVRTGIEMDPIHRDDDEEFLHSIIHEGTQHKGPFEEEALEYDDNKYLNDIGDGDEEEAPEEMAVEDVGAEVYGINA